MPKRTPTKLSYIWKVGDTYHFRESFDGVRIECSLKTSEWELAKTKAQEIRIRFDPSLAKTVKMTVEEIFPSYMEYNEQRMKDGNIRPSTLREFKDVFELHLLKFFGYLQLRNITEELWLEYRETKSGMDLKNHRKVLVHFLRWAHRHQYIPRVPEMKLGKHKKREGISFYDHEIEALLKFSNPNLTLFILMYLTMAMRRSEIMTLKWTNVDFGAAAIYLSEDDTKTDKKRVVPISDSVMGLLAARRMGNPHGLYVFPNLRDPKRHMDRSALKGSWLRAKANAAKELIESAPDAEAAAKIRMRMAAAVPHDLRRTWKSRAHLRADLTDTQKEKFAGSAIEVQKEEYVIMEADQLRPLADVIQIPGIKLMLAQRAIEWGKTGVKGGKRK